MKKKQSAFYENGKIMRKKVVIFQEQSLKITRKKLNFIRINP